MSGEMDMKREEEKEEDVVPTVGHPAKYTLSTMYPKGLLPQAGDEDDTELEEGETETEEVIEVMRFPEDVVPAHVSATLGLTINLGNYESAKVSVTTTLPCYIEDVDNAFKAAETFSGTKMLQEREFILKALKAKGRDK